MLRRLDNDRQLLIEAVRAKVLVQDYFETKVPGEVESRARKTRLQW